jgi:single-strand selective monofunctional uracil DNA glycosylase
VKLVDIAQRLCIDVRDLAFGPPVTHVYNPLEYAWTPHREYLHRYGNQHPQVMLVGMNPGPFGMVQTGIPFGDVPMVRDWLQIEGPVGKPAREHPKRPVDGFEHQRREISGKRLWSWARSAYDTPQRFFSRFFVANYCPLCFLEASGRNRTPDRLRAVERRSLFAACDRALRQTVDCLSPAFVIGIGNFAAARVTAAVGDRGVTVGVVPHPSPANPTANRGWEQAFTAALKALDVDLGEN